MNNYKYFMPVEIVFGRDSLSDLISFPLIQKAKNPLLILGEHLKREHDGTIDKLIFQLGRKLLINNFQIAKSDIDTIDNFASFCRGKRPDLIIAVGGGTILDTAKIGAVLTTNLDSIKDYVVSQKRKINCQGIPLVAIPTTAGTGSEVTSFATVWDTKKKKKYSLDSFFLFPRLALVDPAMTDNLPPNITAFTGMDALAQAIEAYWSKNHNSISDVFALSAIKLIMNNLEKAVNDSNEPTRDKMSQGSLFSGLAFSNTKTTICHSVSYPLTAHFGISHGHAVALTLSPFMEFSFKAIEKERGVKLLEAMSAKDVKHACNKITNLMKTTGMETRLSKLGIKEKDLKTIIAEGFTPERANNAPKIPTSEELHKLLKGIF